MTREVIIWPEEIMNATKTFIDTYLNNQIDYINNTLKDDDFKVPNIADEAWLFQNLDDTLSNEIVTGFIGVAMKTDESTPVAQIETYTVEVDVIYSDPGLTNRQQFTQLFRYQYALKEIFNKNPFKLIGKGERITLTSLQPIVLEKQYAEDNLLRAIGIEFDVTVSN